METLNQKITVVMDNIMQIENRKRELQTYMAEYDRCDKQFSDSERYSNLATETFETIQSLNIVKKAY